MEAFMKNEYGKDKKGYQAKGNENRNPNTPTQGGFSTPGGGQGQNLNKGKQQPQTNKPAQNTWGTGSINGGKGKDDNKDRR